MIAVIDYGVGNLFSLCSSLKYIGYEAQITDDPDIIHAASSVILPGVGAFGNAMNLLKEKKLDSVVSYEAESGKPLLGICLGMQLLFEESNEFGLHKGLGILSGSVKPMLGKIPTGYLIPHIGWNRLDIKKDCPIFRYIKNGDYVYFVHSFYANCDPEQLSASAEYGIPVTAAAANGNVFGCQFHPEKSGEVGLNILRAFCEIGEKQC